MWIRTEGRAAGRDDKGRPSFEQLLVARRAELTLGDVIASHVTEGPVRHILCAAGNNLDCLSNLLIFDAPVTYLSFPISAPRRLEQRGDSSFINLIDEAHKVAAAEMVRNRDRCFISPLSIDELPILGKVTEVTQSVATFNCATDRWNLDRLWGNPALPILPTEDRDLVFPAEQIRNSTEAIKTDVGWCDRRLVMQSKSLAIVCPKPPDEDRITRGVQQEIDTASVAGTWCAYWQKPEWDNGDSVHKALSQSGSMGAGLSEAYMKRLDSLEDLIRAVP
jgi:hypothetical protein